MENSSVLQIDQVKLKQFFAKFESILMQQQTQIDSLNQQNLIFQNQQSQINSLLSRIQKMERKQVTPLHSKGESQQNENIINAIEENQDEIEQKILTQNKKMMDIIIKKQMEELKDNFNQQLLAFKIEMQEKNIQTLNYGSFQSKQPLSENSKENYFSPKSVYLENEINSDGKSTNSQSFKASQLESSRSDLSASAVSFFQLKLGGLMDILGSQFLKQQFKVHINHFINCEVICLYFAQSEDKHSKEFTQSLADFYRKINGKKRLEIIFVSLDKLEENYQQFVKIMPWVSIPYQDERNTSLIKQYNTVQTPQLVVLKKDGSVAIENAKDDIENLGTSCYENLVNQVKLKKQSVISSTNKSNSDQKEFFSAIQNLQRQIKGLERDFQKENLEISKQLLSFKQQVSQQNQQFLIRDEVEELLSSYKQQLENQNESMKQMLFQKMEETNDVDQKINSLKNELKQEFVTNNAIQELKSNFTGLLKQGLSKSNEQSKPQQQIQVDQSEIAEQVYQQIKSSVNQELDSQLNQLQEALLQKLRNDLQEELVQLTSKQQDQSQFVTNTDVQQIIQQHIQQLSSDQPSSTLQGQLLQTVKEQKEIENRNKEQIKAISQQLLEINRSLQAIQKETVSTNELQDLKNEMMQIFTQKQDESNQKLQKANNSQEIKRNDIDISMIESKLKDLKQELINYLQSSKGNQINSDFQQYQSQLEKIQKEIIVKNQLLDTEVKRIGENCESQIEEYRKVNENILLQLSDLKQSLQQQISQQISQIGSKQIESSEYVSKQEAEQQKQVLLQLINKFQQDNMSRNNQLQNANLQQLKYSVLNELNPQINQQIITRSNEQRNIQDQQIELKIQQSIQSFINQQLNKQIKDVVKNSSYDSETQASSSQIMEIQGQIFNLQQLVSTNKLSSQEETQKLKEKIQNLNIKQQTVIEIQQMIREIQQKFQRFEDQISILLNQQTKNDIQYNNLISQLELQTETQKTPHQGMQIQILQGQLRDLEQRLSDQMRQVMDSIMKKEVEDIQMQSKDRDLQSSTDKEQSFNEILKLQKRTIFTPWNENSKGNYGIRNKHYTQSAISPYAPQPLDYRQFMDMLKQDTHHLQASKYLLQSSRKKIPLKNMVYLLQGKE